MKKLTLLCAPIAAALFLSACSQSAAGTADADAKALKDLEAQWNQDFVSKDVGKLVAHYADNAVLVSPGMPANVGKEAIRKMMTDFVSDPNLSLKFQASRVEVSKSGDLGYTQGSYTLAMTDPNTKQVIHDHGSYVTTYSRQADGSWKAVADIASSEVPPPAPTK